MQLFSDAEIVYAIATELESSRVVLKRDVIRKVLKSADSKVLKREYRHLSAEETKTLIARTDKLVLSLSKEGKLMGTASLKRLRPKVIDWSTV